MSSLPSLPTLTALGASCLLALAGCSDPETSMPVAPDAELGGMEAAALTTARRADAVVDAFGVNIHLHYQGLVYDTGYASIIKPRLQELRVRHVRDAAYTYAAANADTFYYQRCRELAALGIKFNLLTSMKTSWGEATDYTKLDDVYAWCNGAVASFEGINEPELQGVTDWVTVVRAAQQKLHQTVKGNPTLQHLPVIGPSVTSEEAARSLGDLSAWLDQGNVHNYYGGRNPESSGWGANGYGSLTYNLNYVARPVSGSKPVTATETGWHNALSTTNGHKATPEKIVGRYMPRLLLSHVAGGLPRSYPYELIDEGTSTTDPEKNFGLLRLDGSPKPSFTAMKNVLTLLSDPGSSFTPGALDYSLSGTTANVRHLLLQKRDGTFYLAVWLAVASWNPDTKVELTVPAQSVTVTVPASVTRATVYTLADTGAMSSSVLTVSSGRIPLSVTDRVTFVALKP